MNLVKDLQEENRLLKAELKKLNETHTHVTYYIHKLL